METGDLNFRWASTLLEALVHAGVRHAVISPGSRSTPLTLACARHPRLTTWVLPDERTAAFFALGLARSSGEPPLVVSTSGTAPAHWYPAVIEASQDLQPLVLVSADRPAELQGCGANQTIDQTALFGRHVRAFVQLPEPQHDNRGLLRLAGTIASAMDQVRWPTPGPVHINLPVHEPLVPGTPGAAPSGLAAPVSVHRAALTPARAVTDGLARAFSGRPGVIACGRGDFDQAFPAAVTELARRLGCPILADPLSGLRYGPHERSRVLASYDAFLRQERFVTDHRPEWVLRFGAAPVSKSLQGYLDLDAPGETTLVVPHGPWPDPGRRATRVIHADPSQVCIALAEAVESPAPEAWWHDFREADTRARTLLWEGAEAPLDLASLRFVGSNCPEDTAIFCGNSMVIRDVDTAMPGGPQRLRLLGNRGASGIDGNVSTTLGLAASWRGAVVGLLGDLALYHDMNGLLAARGLDATLVVYNNGGGAIFDHLPQRDLPELERYWLTPTGLNLEHLTELFGIRHSRIGSIGEFETVFAECVGRPGVDLIEVVVDRQLSVAGHREYWSRVAARVW